MPAAAPPPANSAAPRLGDSLRLILPSVPPELVGPEATGWLTSAAAVLPPVHRAGFECRLAADQPGVDLQQGIFATEDEPGRLARFLAATGALNDAWRTVLGLAERWSEEADPLHDGIAELWLELDAAPASAPGGARLSRFAPSVFAVLSDADAQRSLSIAEAFLATTLDESTAARLRGDVIRYALAGPKPARVSHVGLMLGRSTAALRVHMSRIPMRALDDYLIAIGWLGDRQEVQSLARLLLDYTDALVVCLDVIDGHAVRLGLESFFADNHGLSPRWRPLLERLARLGLSSPRKADALLRWPGTMTPVDVSGPWPENLISTSVIRPEDQLGMFDRRLSHIKLTCTPGLPVSAKVYFGYGHVWTEGSVAAPAAPKRAARRETATVSVALEHAVDWLLAARHQSGWWRDFFGTRFVDSSDEWVTAYVGDALAGVGRDRARSAARDGLALLLTQHDRTSGWGYNVLLPPDGDGTTWTLRLARSLGEVEHERLAAGRHLLGDLTRPDGGVASYTEAAVTPLDGILRIGGSYEGWCAPHLCITAPAAVLGLSDSTLSYLARFQNDDGSWTGYWWDEDGYATAWAVQALAGSPDHRDAVSAAVAWCAGRIGPDGAVRAGADAAPSAFATALALYAMRAAGVDRTEDVAAAAGERAERWLLDSQLEDGSWEPSACLRVAQPDVRDPGVSPELIMYYIPDRGVWTTATVLAALSAAARSRR